jgi:hypothetical protein
MVQRAMVLLCVCSLAVFMLGCGQTYELQSITVASAATGTATVNLEGVGSSDSLIVTAHYSNTKTEDVTVHSTYQLGASADANAPLASLSLNNSGIAKAVGAACTWHATPTNVAASTFAYTTQPYTVTVTYSGFTTQAFINVANAGECYDGKLYPAPTGFAGN